MDYKLIFLQLYKGLYNKHPTEENMHTLAAATEKKLLISHVNAIQQF